MKHKYIGETITEISLVLRKNSGNRICSGGEKISFIIECHERRFCGCL